MQRRNQQGRLRNRTEASHLRMAHPPRRSHAKSRQRGLLQTEDANLSPDDKRQAHARTRLRNARRVRKRPGGVDLRNPSQGRGESGRLKGARARFARRVARARIHRQRWGVAPAPIRGTRSPEPQTRGRIRPRYSRLRSGLTSK